MTKVIIFSIVVVIILAIILEQVFTAGPPFPAANPCPLKDDDDK